AVRRVCRRPDRGFAAAPLWLAGHLYPGWGVSVGACAGIGVVAAGITTLSRPQGQFVAASGGVARTPRHCSRAGGAAPRRYRSQQPNQDAVRRGLCTADGAAVGDLLLQPDELVLVWLLAARGIASDWHDAGRRSVRLEPPGSGRDLCGALSRPADRPR